MHPEAFEWVKAHAAGSTVVDVGGRNINGSVRSLFPAARFTSVDVVAGDGVDVVADFTAWTPKHPVECVVCCEVAEHTSQWVQIIEHAHRILAPGGQFIFTAAGPGRPPHSAADGGPVRSGEWYQNIYPAELEDVMRDLFSDVTVNVLGTDVRSVGTK